MSGPVTSALLRIDAAVYNSSDSSETYDLYDVSTSVSELTGGGAGKIAIYVDLGSGTMYGSRTYTSADDNTLTEIALNSGAIADLNAALGGSFAIGGDVSTLSGQTAVDESLFASSGSARTRQLVLNPVQPVPLLGPIGIVILTGALVLAPLVGGVACGRNQ